MTRRTLSVSLLSAAIIVCSLAGDLRGQACTAITSGAAKHKVILISIDGFRAQDLRNAHKLGLKIPNLREFRAGGTSASGMAWSVSEHHVPEPTQRWSRGGRRSERRLWQCAVRPEQRMNGAEYWYAQSIQVPTLWDIAR